MHETSKEEYYFGKYVTHFSNNLNIQNIFTLRSFCSKHHEILDNITHFCPTPPKKKKLDIFLPPKIELNRNNLFLAKLAQITSICIIKQNNSNGLQINSGDRDRQQRRHFELVIFYDIHVL